MSKRLTIGFVSTWPIYQGTTIDRYAYSLIQGISSAANRLDCNLLLGCGSSISGNAADSRSFWPVPGPDVGFLPVGPWNTDGLIIVPDELNASQIQYIHDLMASGFPVIFTTPEGPGPLVKVDNTQGIRKAIHHLIEHGHSQIAFIAGHFGRGGDSEERLQAYHATVREENLSQDERLVAFGEHRKSDGAAAMQKILDSGVSFSAVIASNDLSCLGAIEPLRSAGLRIPQDVAVIGFDDILDARSLSPSLTTIRHPAFSIGYQAVNLLMEYIQGARTDLARVVVPPQLIIRQSCGCRPGNFEVQKLESSIQQIAQEMAEASLIDSRNSLLIDLSEQMFMILNSFVESLKSDNPDLIFAEIARVLTWTEKRGEDAHIWQTATAVLVQRLSTLLTFVEQVDSAKASSLLDRVRLEIGDQIHRQTTRSMLGYMDMMAQLGQLTAEMLAAMDIEKSAEILARHLPKVGICNALVALYNNDDEEPNSHSTVLFGAGLPARVNGMRFESRKFPADNIYPADPAYQLFILPLDVDAQTTGFVAFNAQNPEMCAAIVLNLGVVLRTGRLYLDALEGRRLAEEANQLKSRFLSMVSHELRTPLSLIVGLSEMSLRQNEVEIRDIEQINTSAQHLARLIGDVLDLASSEAGQLRILKEPLDLVETLQVPIKIGEQLVLEKGLEWKVELPQETLRVLGDKTRLRQVALNLLSNAVKFTQSGCIELKVSRKGDRAILAVNDTGMGIPPAEMQTIFNEFYRSERSMQFGVSGMGLGLAITKQLVERHAGTIEVTSPGDLDCGSTFTMTLPLLNPHIGFSDSMPLFLGADGKVILLTEQNADVSILTEFLAQRGYVVTVCEKDDDANWLESITTQKPAALILDEPLAVHEGWNIVNLLKQQPQTETLPILAYALDTHKKHGEILELNYLLKPLKPTHFAGLLAEITNSTDQKPLILVVDDDPGILEMHRRMIEESGWEALTARNGREALDLLALKRPDLILLDLMMPVMDGFEVLDQLRQSESLREVPVIVLTARHLSESDLERCNRGVANILGKGLFSETETLNHIDAALTRQSPLSSVTRQMVRKAMACIHTRYAEPLTRELIAEQVGISADYLSDCFRQELGITPITYIRRYRIRQACQLLRESDLSITQVAMHVGFSDSAHFTHTFLREMGETPKAYRKKSQ